MDGISVAGGPNRHDPTDPNWWLTGNCANCGPSQFLIVAGTVNNGRPVGDGLIFVRCIRCQQGAVQNRGVQSPRVAAIQPVDGCPADVELAWREALADLGVGSYTSAVMMCRKILFHVAVEKKLKPKDSKGFAPTFVQVLSHLEREGFITPPIKPWVEHIKDVGNEANHDLAPISKDDAERVATFTRQLLVTTYEMPHRMREVLPELAAPDDGEAAES